MSETTKARPQYTTPIGRISFPSVFTARPAMEPGKPDQYECGLILPASEPLTELRAMIAAILKEKFGNKVPGGLKMPIRDGAEKAHIAGLGEGTIYITARSQRKPSVVDGNMVGLSNEADVYGGCYGRLNITPFWFDKGLSKGIALALNAVQKTGDGEPFATVVDVNECFGPVGETAGNTSGW